MRRPSQPCLDGDRLQDLRLRRGWTLRELSRRARVDYSHIARLEHGERYCSNPATIRALARALGVDIRDLLTVDTSVF